MEGDCSCDLAVLRILRDILKTFQSQFQFQIQSISICIKTVCEDGILEDAAFAESLERRALSSHMDSVLFSCAALPPLIQN